jgi:hypothetical protein
MDAHTHDDSPATKKRTLAALRATEEWVRDMRRKLQLEIYGPFSLFSQLPLEVLYIVLQEVLVDDLRHPKRPSACISLLSTCRQARALLHGWSVHAYHLMGGIPLEPAIELRFYLRALKRVRRGRAMEAGCNYKAARLNTTGAHGEVVAPGPDVPDLKLLAYAGHYKAIQWVLSEVGDIGPLIRLAGHRKYRWTVVYNMVPAARWDVVKFAEHVQGNINNPPVGDTLRESMRQVFCDREAWVHALQCTRSYPDFVECLLPLYRDGWLAEWGDLPYDFSSNVVCSAAQSEFRLARVPASSSDPVNPIVRHNVLVAMAGPHWEELELRSAVHAPVYVMPAGPDASFTPRLHTCDRCRHVSITERIRRAHKRGATIVPNDALLNSLGDWATLMDVAGWLHWSPTVALLQHMAKLPGQRCAGMERIAVLSGGRGEWRSFVDRLPDNPLRRRLMAVIPHLQCK